MPRVQKMSLCASGTPVSAAASPAARRASAFFASSSARPSSTVMKAFRAPFSRPMRSRQARVRSTAETFFERRATDSSVSVALSKLLNYLGDEIQAVGDLGPALGSLRRDRLIKRVLVGLARLVGAQPLFHREIRLPGMRHRLDAGGVDRAQLVDQREHPVQALEHLAGLLRRDRDTGKPGN